MAVLQSQSATRTGIARLPTRFSQVLARGGQCRKGAQGGMPVTLAGPATPLPRRRDDLLPVAWRQFLQWVNAYGVMHQILVIAVAPHFTSQQCSRCGQIVKKSLSERTYTCPQCMLMLDRDENAARNILEPCFRLYRGAHGNRRACPVQRFWTGDLYW